MKTLSPTIQRVSYAAMLATFIVGIAVATTGHAEPLSHNATSAALQIQTVQLNQQTLQSESVYEQKQEQKLTNQLANAEDKHVAKICDKFGFEYDQESYACKK